MTGGAVKGFWNSFVIELALARAEPDFTSVFLDNKMNVSIRGMRGLNLVGGDVVEVSPPFDMSGNTALVAVTMMFEILCLLAEQVSQRKAG